ncbi:hypothetical protein EG68_12335 [Paragonimus skrjabini miyazakii]|uniref:BRO1 domain-containing protein n=1 Tax=Paragonimus skrjabini miyazakii TaxID=59628 RepID=A0A8S9YGM1_9TREM|nr:hypothetical protein EG68_12335 [Paragonimus skrjabini miyazakii]
MESLPRISMIGLSLKTSDDLPDLGPMKKCIEAYYQHSSDMYQKEFTDFLSCRKAACEPSIDYTGLSKQKRYYAQLQLAKGRFRSSVEDGTAVSWNWRDVFTNSLVECPHFVYEEAAILFNIGALHTILAVKEKRADADSMKVACTHFQCAVWAFDTICEQHRLPHVSSDLNSDVLCVFSSIMTAQAQECIVEKSVLDERPANTTAKLTQYLAQTYEQTTNQLSLPSILDILPSKFQKELRRRCELKSAYYGGLAAYFSGLSEDGNKKYGKAIAWYQLAERRIADADKIAKEIKDTESVFPTNQSVPLRSNVQFVSSVIQNRYV